MINKIFNIQYSISNYSRGFTILESIVAIAVLSLSVSGAFSAVTQSLSQATIAKDEVKAFYLAQEAIEVIRNKRDANQLSLLNTGSGFWLAGIAQYDTDPCYFEKVCQIDANPIPPTLVYCNSSSWGSCAYLKQNPTTFMYNYTTGTATNFKREIKIESVNANEVAIIVRVSWTKGIITREFKIKSYLFNWI
ncbi:MAG: type II secretion system protein [Candidatus Paceibacterota bacterium]|jgi:prepilin-type N-terminal cleavage/methylation domain-containing protein